MASATDLMVRIYGHDVSASKALKDVGKEAETVGGKLKHIGKMGAVGFAAVGAAALTFAEEGVRAAIKVEKQQKQLDIAIKNNTKSTKEQAKGANEYLEKLRLTYGVSNEKLIPAYAKLVRSTKDLGESQKLMNLAMNISAGTGKDLGAVSVALSKAYNGNFASLTRLGVPIDKTIIKHKDFKGAVDALSKTFNGSAKASTETFSGKMAILQQNLDSAKEKIGIALLPIIMKFANYILINVVPYIQAFVAGLTGSKGLHGAAGKATQGIHDFGEKVRSVFKWLNDHKHILVDAAAAMAAFWATGKIGKGLSAMKAAFGALKKVFVSTTEAAVTTAAAEDAAAGPAAPGLMLAQAAAAAAVFAAFGMSDLWGGIALPKYTPGKGATGNTYGESGNQQTLEVPGESLGPHGELPPGAQPPANKYFFDPKKKQWYQLLDNGGHNYNVYQKNKTGHASGGAVAAGTQIMVGENGPELFTPTSGGSITPHNLVGGSGMNVHIHVAGSVIHEKDLAVTVRDNIAQLMRRRGLNPAILGV